VREVITNRIHEYEILQGYANGTKYINGRVWLQLNDQRFKNL